MEGNATLEGSSSVDREDRRSAEEENDGIVIKEMTLDDLRTAVRWTHDMGWSPGDRDADLFYKADEKGFFMAKTANGDPVVSISAIRLNEKFGVLGLYICVPEQRGKGYGTTIFSHAMRHMGKRVIGLDSVPEQCSNYAKWGFVTAYEIISYAGEVNLEALPPVPVSTDDVTNHIVVEELGQGRMDALLEFDKKHVPAVREQFLRGWLTAPGHIVRIAIAGEEIKGYGVVRPCTEIPRIGPLFAESVEVAGLLMRALVTGNPQGRKIIIDIPAPNNASIEMIGRLGLTVKWRSFRMYRGSPPELPLERIYGLTCYELG